MSKLGLIQSLRLPFHSSVSVFPLREKADSVSVEVLLLSSWLYTEIWRLTATGGRERQRERMRTQEAERGFLTI